MAANSGQSETRLIGVASFSTPAYALCPFSLAAGLSDGGQGGISPTRLQARGVYREVDEMRSYPCLSRCLRISANSWA